jgi:two-component system chemotaxis sensor kinase CheA
MSHELRTPLNSILLLASLLADNKTGGLSAKEVEFAKTIHASGSDLLNLIEDILDLSKIESGKMQPDFSCVSLASVLGNMEQHFRPLADAKQIALYIAAADAPETILTDERRLEQILKNLLANAIKFTRQGSVALKVSANDGAVRFAVSDTGIGIAKDQQEIIFESFRQADGKTSRMYGGTGLGLAICRELAGLLNGRIEVESELGAGSTFTLTLPVASGAINEAAAAAGPLLPIISEHAHGEAAADSYLTGKKVLIVDDDMRNVFALTIALEEKKMEVIVAQNGREGLLQLEQHSDIELVLMDIMMPEMDGYEAMRQIRGQGLKLPVIALTAKAMKADRENCIKAGASDYLVKPVQMDQLMSLMRVWLHP